MWTQKKKLNPFLSFTTNTHAINKSPSVHKHKHRDINTADNRTVEKELVHWHRIRTKGRVTETEEDYFLSSHSIPVTWQAQRHQPAHLLGVGGGFDEAAKHRAQPAPCLFVFMLCAGSKVLLRQVSAARQPHGKFASLCVYLTSRACCKRLHQLLLQRWVCMELSCTTELVNMTWPLIVLHGRHSCTAAGWRYGCDRWCRLLLLFTFSPYTYLSVPNLRVYSCRYSWRVIVLDPATCYTRFNCTCRFCRIITKFFYSPSSVIYLGFFF